MLRSFHIRCTAFMEEQNHRKMMQQGGWNGFFFLKRAKGANVGYSMDSIPQWLRINTFTSAWFSFERYIILART